MHLKKCVYYTSLEVQEKKDSKNQSELINRCD